MCSARAAAALLPHVNLLLMVIVGGGMATAARLKWDPSTYIVVRELLPLEYRVLGALLLAAPLALLVLAHLAAAALSLRESALRRVLMLTYAICMIALLVGEVVAAWWVGRRAAEWLQSEQAQRLQELVAARDDLRALLAMLARWHPLPEKVHQLIDEASEDLPRNAYCAAALAVATVALQLLGVALAALVALAPLRSARSRRRSVDTDSRRSLLYGSRNSDPPSLKTIYKNGRLQIV
ncbi:uncharacterized protein LOC128672047 [Plodia interpunctella]|uniref:uncharacterized protein LOC128672047 n=1 Tax=Plodia interpunctella TaxID=58824 RepID=UPI0023680BA9|nr:uncharacterized protein LOC128672047 [Plodia interpunctella]